MSRDLGHDRHKSLDKWFKNQDKAFNNLHMDILVPGYGDVSGQVKDTDKDLLGLDFLLRHDAE